MDDTIKVTKTDNGNVIDARELYTMLGSKRHFGDWVKQFLTNSKIFEENIDYWSYSQHCENQKSGRQRIHYTYL
jgi:phage anti-repressor protein